MEGSWGELSPWAIFVGDSVGGYVGKELLCYSTVPQKSVPRDVSLTPSLAKSESPDSDTHWPTDSS